VGLKKDSKEPQITCPLNAGGRAQITQTLLKWTRPKKSAESVQSGGVVSFVMSHENGARKSPQYLPVPRPLKKVKMRGGLPMAERDVLAVRRSECQGQPT
jgi:hypothetical protein